VDDEEAYVCNDAGSGIFWAPKYCISQKVADTKRVSNVWNYFGDLCVNQSSNLENLNNMKTCLARRSKIRDNIVSMGGGNRKSSTCAKIVSHLQHVHLGDGQYTAYLDMDKARLARKSIKETPSKNDQPSIVPFANDNKEVIKRKYKIACARWIVGTRQPINA
jgi:hypothetical protein